MPPFRDDHILIIYPGSQTTLAQLGLPESFTPAKVRIPSRMFPGIEEGTWTATKIREAREGEKEDLIAKQKAAMGSIPEDDEGDDDEDDDVDEEMDDGTETKATSVDGAATEGIATVAKDTPTEGAPPATETSTSVPKKEESATPKKTDAAAVEGEEAEVEGDEDEDEDMGEDGVYVEDEDDEEGAVWCMKEGKVVDWGCFFALLQHVHETINPTFHTPILMLYPPNFDDRDKELLTQFVFEKLKAPGFAIMDASLAVLWAYGVSTATVVDVGYEKTDITPVVDFIVQERARTTVSGWGGDSMTKHLAKLLPHMKAEEVEQLKRSPICEILSSGTVLPTAGSVNAAIAAGEKNRKVTDLDNMDLDVEDEDGSFNVAAIVASGKTREFLAKKEKEKRGEFERRLPNREREHNTFWLVEKKKPGEEGVVIIEEPLSAVATTAPLLPLPEKAVEPAAPAPAEPEVPAAEPATATASAAEGEDKPITDAPPAAPAADAAAPAEGAPAAPQEASATAPAAATAAPAEDDAERKNKEKEKRKEERRAAAGGLPPLAEDEQYREVEVGIERFQAAECGILHEIADNLWRLWQSLIVVGNGSKVRGFKDALLSTIQGKYHISPSSNTIFTSELPSGLSTPMATGASTPNPQNPMGGPSQPNPLLVAATTHASQNPYMQQQHHHNAGHGYSQTPTTIKYVKAPEYFPEWKDAGFEEVGFLGAQVAAKVLFVVDQGASQGFLTRVEYNEGGPSAIHNV
ncbi:hypothetical protein P167DRAFT_491600 [Morchella conica CCBAS932]|uniref:Actin-like ATPase domain-containing protein n=1 Tax=Morchella conica CCBAS932 TaxID=1392247 RepID=A0A3N4KWB6_9PEZI|nr:hypothetical protein P167DRAFT_491600 [Morchella conica CCBAS932]